MTRWTHLFILLTLPMLTGCNAIKNLIAQALQAYGVTVDVTGTVNFEGLEPDAVSVDIFAPSNNPDGFDDRHCDKVEKEVAGETILVQEDPGCYGRINMIELTSPSTDLDGNELIVDFDGSDFTVEDVPIDFGFIVQVSGDDPSITCTFDFVGYNERTKLTTVETMVTIETEIDDLDILSFELPKAAELFCYDEKPFDEDDVKVVEPVEDEDLVNNGGHLVTPGDTSGSWTSFIVGELDRHHMPEDIWTGGDGLLSGTIDLTDGSKDANYDCRDIPGADTFGGEFPDRLVLIAETDSDQDTAFVRVEYGKGDDVDIRTFEAELRNGKLVQAVPMTGGPARVQVDLNDALDGVGESQVGSFCQSADENARQMVVYATWNEKSDIDLEVLVDDMPAAWYCAPETHGVMVITNDKGYGAEAYSSMATVWEGGSDETYELKVHNYDGNATDVLVRMVYTAPTGETCDFSVEGTVPANDWWVAGSFGPDTNCLADLMAR
jgi:hypothetical protein